MSSGRKGPMGGHGHGHGMGKGEKAKESTLGVTVLVHMEHRPNTPPRIPPAAGPRRTAPKITGMCMVVALITGSGIKPIPVIPITSRPPTAMRIQGFFSVWWARCSALWNT